MRRVNLLMLAVPILLAWSTLLPAVTDSQFQTIRTLGMLNGVALHCGYLEQTRRMKRALIENLPKRQALGQGFDDVTNESFLLFLEQRQRCPGPATFAAQVDEAIEALKQAFPAASSTQNQAK